MNYWQKRQQQLNKQMEKDEAKLKKRLSSYFDTEYRKLDKQIAAYYKQYGTDNVIQYRRLMESLSDDDKRLLIEQMDEFAKKYPEYAHLMPVRESIYKLNRLEGLQYSVRMQQLEIGAVENEQITAHLNRNAERGVNAAAEAMGFGKNFYANNPDISKLFINIPWSNGENFSQKIWNNTTKLANYLNSDIAQGIARGDSYERLTRRLRERFSGVSRNDAYRLIYTEGTYVMAEVTMQPFTEDFEKYRLSTVGDGKVCSVCRGVAREVFNISDRQPGVNFPPLHPWCRCTFTIEVDDWDKWMEDYERKHGNGQAKKVEERLNVNREDDIIFIRKVAQFTRDEDLKAVNPNYVTGAPEWTRNCQRCVSAYEARRRGYDVTAKPRILDGTDRLPVMNDPQGWPTVYQNYELIQCSSNSGAGTGRKVEKKMQEWGDGARAIVRVRWKHGGGHVFIAEQLDGETRFIDPQTGRTDASSYFERVKKNGTYVMRIDNLEFTDRIKECCKNVR